MLRSVQQAVRVHRHIRKMQTTRIDVGDAPVPQISVVKRGFAAADVDGQDVRAVHIDIITAAGITAKIHLLVELDNVSIRVARRVAAGISASVIGAALPVRRDQAKGRRGILQIKSALDPNGEQRRITVICGRIGNVKIAPRDRNHIGIGGEKLIAGMLMNGVVLEAADAAQNHRTDEAQARARIVALRKIVACRREF